MPLFFRQILHGTVGGLSGTLQQVQARSPQLPGPAQVSLLGTLICPVSLTFHHKHLQSMEWKRSKRSGFVPHFIHIISRISRQRLTPFWHPELLAQRGHLSVSKVYLFTLLPGVTVSDFNFNSFLSLVVKNYSGHIQPCQWQSFSG